MALPFSEITVGALATNALRINRRPSDMPAEDLGADPAFPCGFTDSFTGYPL
jgi:hypothetical protein